MRRRRGTLAYWHGTWDGSIYTQRRQFNIRAFSRPAAGRLLLTFTNPLPDDWYGVEIGARFGDFNDGLNVQSGPNRLTGAPYNERQLELCFHATTFGIFDPDRVGVWVYDPATV